MLGFRSDTSPCVCVCVCVCVKLTNDVARRMQPVEKNFINGEITLSCGLRHRSSGSGLASSVTAQ